MTHLLSSADISIFSMEISNFFYIEEYKCRFQFKTETIVKNFFEPLKVVLLNMVAILMMSAKLAYLDFIKI